MVYDKKKATHPEGEWLSFALQLAGVRYGTVPLRELRNPRSFRLLAVLRRGYFLYLGGDR